MWGSEFFKETLINILLLFDEREQLLLRKKTFSIFQNCTCYENVTEPFISKSGTKIWANLELILPLFSLSTTQTKVFKIILHIYVNSYGHRMYSFFNTALNRQLDVKSAILMGLEN